MTAIADSKIVLADTHKGVAHVVRDDQYTWDYSQGCLFVDAAEIGVNVTYFPDRLLVTVYGVNVLFEKKWAMRPCDGIGMIYWTPHEPASGWPKAIVVRL